ncbi:uncharacterized protein N7506_011437 [Penicillium brevicompactum]|uniref:uncharacterized protein n=1 Tax=Penicillium brevicompactum TaxID=5074 RepID=UPI0025409E94|nr:uncharacterized protein N7506_011437 [Penicillium brevicompactum]KAJ5322307.1 hypothetical protein N7506_011437 [Penicillium brevicompactum]
MNSLMYSATDEVWQGELLDSPLCQKCLELHDHACSPLSKPLPADAMSLPPRSIKSGITGALSLHDYRKFLSKSADRIDDPVDHAGRKLKRKTAALHLNRPPALNISYPNSVSSASSPPPLSPSYSHSIISQRSEEPEIGEAHPVHYQSPSPRVTLVSDNGTRTRPNRKRLNTFREKFQQNKAQAQAEAEVEARKAEPDSMLASTQAVATVSHGGACFEILNPRKSLDLARIVSYIEDVDSCSILSDQESTFPLDQGLDRVSISQYTDASLPSFYSANSLYTSLDQSTPKGQEFPSPSPGNHGRVHSLSEYSLNEGFNYWSRPVQNNSENDRHDDPQTAMTSIREESVPPALSDSHTHSRRPSTPSTQDFYSESEIGEPGSPVYANGEWAQVDERDRGIFYELEEFDQPEYHHDRDSEPSPHESLDTDTPLHSPITPLSPFDLKYDPYDPIYFDPHVQSVLAAANAENMGLRGTRQLDGRDFQRRKSDERKAGGGRG